MPRPLRVVHLPVYRDNAYQPLLLAALARRGIEVLDGGGGGTFLRTALTRWKPDAVHFHWLHPYMIRPTALGTLARGVRLVLEVALLRLVGVRIVWTLHNLHNHDRAHVRLERWLTRLFVRLTDRVIAHCPTAERLGRAAFSDRRRGRWVTIPHGNYVGCYADELGRPAARAQLGLPADELVVLFFGRIQPYKGVLDLIAAFRAAALPGARLVIAGRPADADADRVVAAAAAGCAAIVYRPGFVPDDGVQILMRAADAVALPFRDVLTSGSVLLAMSFGRAVIAPALGCVPETVADGHDLLYRPDDPDGLRAALTAAADRRAELPAIGAANFRRVAHDTWDAVAERTADEYRCPLGTDR
jgi:glycosyltransferase involved in cell wall biosynthesis